MKLDRLCVSIAFALSASADAVSAHSLTAEESKLARCTGVLPYAVNLSLLQDNIGAAKSLNLQSAKVNTAFFFVSSVENKIPSWKMRLADELTDDLRLYYAQEPSRLASEVDECISLGNLIMSKAVSRGETFEGEDFVSFMSRFSKYTAELLGI